MGFEPAPRGRRYHREVTTEKRRPTLDTRLTTFGNQPHVSSVVS